LEIFTSNGEVIFKKYSPMGEMSSFATDYVSAIAEATRLAVVICDRDRCIAAAGAPKRDLLEKSVSQDLENLLEERKLFTFNDSDEIFALVGCERKVCAVSPIISAGDIAGAVVLLENDNYNTVSESDVKLIEVASRFLGSRIE
jgi:AbrB family transcriptional regulator (stage V sporulation protein T)